MWYTLVVNGETVDVVNVFGGKEAHERAAACAAVLCDGVESVAAYPAIFRADNGRPTAAGIARAAFFVAKHTAHNGVKRSGSESQWKLDNEFCSASVRIANGKAERIETVVSSLSQDAQEYYSHAKEGVCLAVARGLDTQETYHAAFLHLNAYVHSLRGAAVNEHSLEWIHDGNGELVTYYGAVARILKGGERWTPCEGGELTTAQAAEIGAAIRGACAAVLNPTQRDIVKRLAKGYSQRQIAEQTGRNLRTIEGNCAAIRAAMYSYLLDTFPRVAEMVNGDKVRECAEKHSDAGRRTQEGAERHKAAQKATQAARAKAYRERKKAAKEAMKA